MKQLTLEVLYNIIEKETGFNEGNLASVSRERELTNARHIACYCMKNYLLMTHSAIGEEFFRNHSTCVYAIKSLSGLLETEEKYRSLLKHIETQIKKYAPVPKKEPKTKTKRVRAKRVMVTKPKEIIRIKEEIYKRPPTVYSNPNYQQVYFS